MKVKTIGMAKNQLIGRANFSIINILFWVIIVFLATSSYENIFVAPKLNLVVCLQHRAASDDLKNRLKIYKKTY